MAVALIAVAMAAAVLYIGYQLGKRSGAPEKLARPTGLKVLVIGVDGAEWDVIEPLMEEGRLPAFSRLVKEGAHGKLRSLEPTLSPIIWTSIATGKTPDKHGITWFMVKDPEHSRRFPVQSTMRTSKAVWNILSEHGLTAGVIGWWATYPAERVNGFVVSDYVAYHAFGLSGKQVKTGAGKTHPPSLHDQVLGSLKDPLSIDKAEIDKFMKVTGEEYDYSVGLEFDFGNPLHHFMYSLATTGAYHDMGLKLYRQYRPDWMGIYFEQVDSISHLYMKYAPPRIEGLEDKYFDKYSRVVDNYYVYQDKIIADFMGAADDKTVVIICSDHGFKTGDERLSENLSTSLAKAHLWHQIDGVVIMWGGPIKPGMKIEGASVLDITPTALYLLGMPLARDMDGKILMEAVSEDFLDSHPVRFVETYEQTAAGATVTPVGPVSGVDEEMLARLSALGYISDDFDDTEIRRNRVNEHLKRGAVDQALAEVETVLKKDVGSVWARHMKAMIHERQGRVEEALAILLELADEAEGQVKQKDRLVYAQALMTLAAHDHVAGATDEAIKKYQRSLELFPENPDAEYNLGVLHESSEDHHKAIERYQKATLLNPEHALARNNLGNCFLKVGEIQKAIAEFKKTAEIDPKHIECRHNLGALYQQIGRRAEAAAEFEAALAISPDFAPAQSALATIRLESGEYEKARALLEKLLAKDPYNPAHLFMLAKAEAEAGNLKKAKDLINRASAIDREGIRQGLERDPELRKLIEAP